jgi:tetratricopeptide (TPR) repeat protein
LLQCHILFETGRFLPGFLFHDIIVRKRGILTVFNPFPGRDRFWLGFDQAHDGENMARFGSLFSQKLALESSEKNSTTTTTPMMDPANYFKAQGLSLFYDQNYDVAIWSFERALGHVKQRDDYRAAELYNLIGYAVFRKGDYSAALKAFQKAVNVKKDQQPDLDLGWVYYRMGKCFHESGDYEMAASYLKKASRIFEAESPLGRHHTMTRKVRTMLSAITRQRGRSVGRGTPRGSVSRDEKKASHSISQGIPDVEKHNNQRDAVSVRSIGRGHLTFDGKTVSIDSVS